MSIVIPRGTFIIKGYYNIIRLNTYPSGFLFFARLVRNVVDAVDGFVQLRAAVPTAQRGAERGRVGRPRRSRRSRRRARPRARPRAVQPARARSALRARQLRGLAGHYARTFNTT